MSITGWTTGMKTDATPPRTSILLDGNVRFSNMQLIVPKSYRTIPAKKSGASKAKSQYTDYVKAKPKAPPETENTSFNAYRPVVSKEDENSFMSSLLGEASAVAHAPAPRKSRKRKEKYQLSDDEPGFASHPAALSSQSYRESRADSSSDGFEFLEGNASSGDDISWAASPRKKPRTSAPMVKLPPIGSLEVKSDHEDTLYDQSFDDIDVDDFMDVEPPVRSANGKPNGAPNRVKQEYEEAKLHLKSLKPVNGAKKNEDEVPAWLSTYDSLAIVKNEDSIGSSSKASASSSGAVDALEEDGSLRFFWIDYLEHEGKIYFVGKVMDKKTDAWASCCITVENLQRNLFVLPRDRRVETVVVGASDNEDDDEEMDEYEDEEEQEKRRAKKRALRKKQFREEETDDIPELQDVYSDFDQVRRKAGIKKFRAKFVKRKYAFGEKEVPREERMWLKVVYGFDGKASFPDCRCRLTSSQNRKYRTMLHLQTLPRFLVPTRRRSSFLS